MCPEVVPETSVRESISAYPDGGIGANACKIGALVLETAK
jgi:hypothetical protein